MTTPNKIDLDAMARLPSLTQAETNTVLAYARSLSAELAQMHGAAGNALRLGAKVLQLYDDVTMAGDYMIDANDAEGILIALADYVDRFTAPQGKVMLPVELRGVAETVAEGAGQWKECTGCYDTEDGRPTRKYAYSKVFGCDLGCGCSECGGLGVVWDDTDYAAMAAFMEQQDASPAGHDATGAVHADTKRLDFLDRMNNALNEHYGTTYGWELIMSHHVTRMLVGRSSAGHIGWLDMHDSKARGATSCREAIDAAMDRAARGDR